MVKCGSISISGGQIVVHRTLSANRTGELIGLHAPVSVIVYIQDIAAVYLR